jgi:hypothetical protein
LEIARFAASSVRAEYKNEPNVTDVYRLRDTASAVTVPSKTDERMRAAG